MAEHRWGNYRGQGRNAYHERCPSQGQADPQLCEIRVDFQQISVKTAVIEYWNAVDYRGNTAVRPKGSDWGARYPHLHRPAKHRYAFCLHWDIRNYFILDFGAEQSPQTYIWLLDRTPSDAKPQYFTFREETLPIDEKIEITQMSHWLNQLSQLFVCEFRQYAKHSPLCCP